MPNVSPLKIALLWAIPKLLAPAAAVSNARLATNGRASNPIRKSVKNTASLSPAPAPTKPESAKLVTVNTPNAPVPVATFGTIRLKNVNMIIRQTASSVRCITAMALAHKIKLAPKLYLVLLYTKKLRLQMVG